MKRILSLMAFCFLTFGSPAFPENAGDVIPESGSMSCFIMGRTLICLTPTSTMMCDQIGPTVYCSETALARKPVDDADEWREWTEGFQAMVYPLEVEMHRIESNATKPKDLFHETVASAMVMAELREKLSLPK